MIFLVVSLPFVTTKVSFLWSHPSSMLSQQFRTLHALAREKDRSDVRFFVLSAALYQARPDLVNTGRRSGWTLWERWD